MVHSLEERAWTWVDLVADLEKVVVVEVLLNFPAQAADGVAAALQHLKTRSCLGLQMSSVAC